MALIPPNNFTPVVLSLFLIILPNEMTATRRKFWQLAENFQPKWQVPWASTVGYGCPWITTARKLPLWVRLLCSICCLNTNVFFTSQLYFPVWLLWWPLPVLWPRDPWSGFHHTPLAPVSSTLLYHSLCCLWVSTGLIFLWIPSREWLGTKEAFY